MTCGKLYPLIFQCTIHSSKVKYLESLETLCNWAIGVAKLMDTKISLESWKPKSWLPWANKFNGSLVKWSLPMNLVLILIWTPCLVELNTNTQFTIERQRGQFGRGNQLVNYKFKIQIVIKVNWESKDRISGRMCFQCLLSMVMSKKLTPIS